MTTSKSEVVSIRVEPKIKAALQSAADREMRNLANMMEVMMVAYCKTQGYSLQGVRKDAQPNTKSKS